MIGEILSTLRNLPNALNLLSTTETPNEIWLKNLTELLGKTSPAQHFDMMNIQLKAIQYFSAQQLTTHRLKLNLLLQKTDTQFVPFIKQMIINIQLQQKINQDKAAK